MSEEITIGYGLTYRQIETIKMSVYRFGEKYGSIAKRYQVPRNAIRKIIETKQFDDIEPKGGY